MASDKPREIIFSRTGQQARAIYDPDLAPTMDKLGEVTTQRASHVEPSSELSNTAVLWLARDAMPQPPELAAIVPSRTATLDPAKLREALPPNAWWADCYPVGGPVLGPFDDRDTALQAEADWLRENNIPVCEPCREETDCSIQIEPPTSPVLTEDEL